MDQLNSFNIQGKGVLVVNPRTDTPGILELRTTNEETLFLFKGSLSLAECEAGVKNASFLLAANTYCPGVVEWDAQQSSYTLYAETNARGYVRIVER